ncbi:MAG TPA: gephyrin-like molybdotransferase Glp [Thermoanaerobaculia bacterium]|jgi:molybdopterin molybdotransferase|nr:gephyrin-like molybdotransferase Glp [Thermoanaerobaculia bacterium]
MLSVEEAQARVMDEIAQGPSELVSLSDAHGRVLREEIVASYDLPSADNSGMDGYAVRAEDIANAPVTLPVRGDIPAGHPAATPLDPGTAMRIMTGAFVPEGADTVVQVELTDGGLEAVRVDAALRPGANIRRRGEDIRRGDVLLRAGVRIGAPELTVLAAMQKTRVAVGRRPTVAIFSTGDELVGIDEPLAPGKIVNTNSWLLEALVREAGAVPVSLGIVGDTKDATIAALERAAASDFVLSSGGVSVGAYDFVKEALETLGAESKFWRVNMKPGKPVVVSRLRERVVFGLPGNPVSSFVSFHLFVAPALRKAMGQDAGLFPPAVRATLTHPLKSAGERRVYFRVAVNGALEASPLASQGSGSLTSMLGANGLAIVPEGITRVEAGSPVDVLLLGALR